MKKIILLLLVSFTVFGQKFNPEEVISKMKKEIEKVNDYSADIHIKLDISYIKMPDVNAKIYFKKPDKFHATSEGFALIPKQGMNFSPLKFMEKKYTALSDGIIEINGNKYYKIKILPEKNDTSSGPSIIELSINTENYTVSKITTIGDGQGKNEVNIDYQVVEDKYFLPKKIFMMVDVGSVKFRKKNNSTVIPYPQDNDARIGKVYIDYSNYAVNKGLDDKIFEKAEKKNK